jgi:methylenetetrahydrofolate reductase (NADPH)
VLTTAENVVADLLRHPRVEVMPFDGIDEEVLACVPPHVTVTVTSSPSRGIDATLAVCERLAAHGYRAVPHLAARLVVDEVHLRELLARLDELGLREVFVIAGDIGHPAGRFEGAAALLRAMAEADHRLEAIGITGYPESHAFISDETTIQAMFDKAPMATYIVSQICFSPAVIGSWIRRVRDRGVQLPIYVGLPGPVAAGKLLRVSGRIGLGESARFLGRHGTWVGRLLLPHAYRPERLLERLSPHLADPDNRVAGLHLFTFNELSRTERWRAEAVGRPASQPTSRARPRRLRAERRRDGVRR